MTEENVPVEVAEQGETERAPAGPATPVTPPQSRFLFVDVAALRAKQLRRGAMPRLSHDSEADERPDLPFKPERIAMEEVRRGLVEFQLSEPLPPAESPLESE